MNKKKKFKIIVITLSLILICFIILKICIRDVKYKEYEKDTDYFIDLDNDSKEEKIRFDSYGDKGTDDLFPFKNNYDIIINDKVYNYKLRSGFNVSGFYIIDINNDGFKEIMVRKNEIMTTTSNSLLLIYNFENEELNYKNSIYFGDLKYSFITKTIIVKKINHDSIKEKIEYEYYKF